VLDLPNKDWPDLVSIMSTNANNENPDIKKSSITTLGFICEKLSANKLQPEQSEVDLILGGVACGLLKGEANTEIISTSLKAVQDMIPFFKDRLQDEKTRDFFLSCILENAARPEEELVLKAIQCLIDIFKNCYQYLDQRYMNVICEKTLALMGGKNSSIVIATTEFWNSVAKFEAQLANRVQKDRLVPQHFIQAYAIKLSEALLRILMLKDSDEDSDAGLSTHSAAMDCLVSINQLAPAVIRNHNIEFIKAYVGSDQELHKIAALRCFEAMISGSSEDNTELIKSSFEGMLSLLSGSRAVQRAVLKVVCAISANYPLLLVQDAVVQKWFELCVRILESDRQLAPLVCRIFADCGNGLYGRPDFGPLFLHGATQLCKILLEYCFVKLEQTDIYLATEIFIARMSLARSLTSVAQLNDFLQDSVNCLLNLSKLQGEFKLTIKEGLLIDVMVRTADQTCLQMMRRLKLDLGQLNNTAITRSYEAALSDCSEASSVFPSALMVLVAIAQRRPSSRQCSPGSSAQTASSSSAASLRTRSKASRTKSS